MIKGNFIIKLRILLWAGLALIVFLLFYFAVIPGGRIGYKTDFQDNNFFIRKLNPPERIAQPNEGESKIIGNPVYFYLRTPRRFNIAEMTIKYKTNGNLPIIEAGVLADKNTWKYAIKPVENNIIGRLLPAWSVINEDGHALFQREKKFNTLNDFLNNFPARSEVAVYNYGKPLPDNFIISSYDNSEARETKLDYPLIGSWEFYTYIKNEELDFSFDFLDLNKENGEDPINLYLYYKGKAIDKKNYSDDGVFWPDGEKKEKGFLKFKLADLPEGIYKIELKAGNDIITKSITAKQKIISFANKINLAKSGDIVGNKNTAINIFTDSRILNFQSVNPSGLQKIKIENDGIDIANTYEQYQYKTASATSEIILEKDGLTISGDGVFSFTRENLINPEITKVNENFVLENNPVNYILADYNQPKEEDGWKIAKINFDLTGAYREFNKYTFLISIPGMDPEDDKNDDMEIKDITIDLKGTSLKQKIKKIIRR